MFEGLPDIDQRVRLAGRSATRVARAAEMSAVRRPWATDGFISHELANRGAIAADRAVGIARQGDLPEPHLQRVIQEQPANERLADAGQEA